MDRTIVIAGATATGKTQTAINLAKIIDGEIISADSMQIYKGMNIGTAKPTIEEMEGIPHYLIDEVCPNEGYSVARFKERADECAAYIRNKKKTPIIVGGTGFYINAFLYGNSFTQTDDDNSIRNKYYSIAEEKGKEYVFDILKSIDKKYAEQTHFNNVKRVVRAIEFYEKTGELFSDHNEKENNREMSVDADIYLLNMPRDILYKRLDERVDLMVENGLINEVKELLQNGVDVNSVAMNGIGYKELVPYLNGGEPLESCVSILKRNTRRYAKRQITWFKNQLDGQWIDISLMEFDAKLAANFIKCHVK